MISAVLTYFSDTINIKVVKIIYQIYILRLILNIIICIIFVFQYIFIWRKELNRTTIIYCLDSIRLKPKESWFKKIRTCNCLCSSPDRLELSPWPTSKWKLDSLKYPVLPNKIPELEDKLKLRINLFSFDDAFGYKRYALYISKRYYNEKINLLFWDGRYARIKHFSRLFFDTTKYVAYIWVVLILKYI